MLVVGCSDLFPHLDAHHNISQAICLIYAPYLGTSGEFGSFTLSWGMLMASGDFAAGFVPFPTLCMCLCIVNASVTRPKPSASHLHQVSAPIGEFGNFCLFCIMLTNLHLFAAALTPIQTLCVCMRMPDMSMVFPSLTGSSVCNLALPPDEYGGLGLFCWFLTWLQVFSSCLHCSARVCMCLTCLRGPWASLACSCAIL